MKAPLRRSLVLLSVLLAHNFLAQMGLAQTDGGWPKEVDFHGRHFTIYQPQVESWRNDLLQARAVVSVATTGTPPGAPVGTPQQVYGIVSLSAHTDVDKESRTVALNDIQAKSAEFPSATNRKSELLQAIRESLPSWPRIISLDRLLADLAITQSETSIESIPLQSRPPKIFFSTVPAVLILIEGEAQLRPVAGTRYTQVINTPALLLFDSGTNRYYLDGQNCWMTAGQLNGPWEKAANPPADLEQVKQQLNRGEEKDPDAVPSVQTPPPSASVPKIYVSTVPAELLQTDGEPQYAPIGGTKLSWVTNTESDIFLDISKQSFYVLLAGRWYRSKSLNGPWDWAPGKELPSDFARIPLNSPKSGVLASVPGTEQSKEAVIANQIPQTAAVKRTEMKLEVHYDGPPQFRPIEGSAMEYAINTDIDVIHAEGRYYACRGAVWFVADSPSGPWSVADFIPAVIYTLPPSSPLFHDRYVYVYRSTPDLVYVGYTPGYLGAYVWDGVVVFGTGWFYPGWYGSVWYGWPWTWGFGFHFGYWGGGWFWRPAHPAWWFHNPPYMHRVYAEHWNPHWNPRSRGTFRYNANVYNRLPERALVRRSNVPAHRPQAPSRPPSAGARRDDFYAGPDGHVYENRPNGWYRQDGSGQWQRQQPAPRLEQQRQSRTLGQSRQGEFQKRGPSPGVPATRAPAPRGRPTPAPAARGGSGRR